VGILRLFTDIEMLILFGNKYISYIKSESWLGNDRQAVLVRIFCFSNFPNVASWGKSLWDVVGGRRCCDQLFNKRVPTGRSQCRGDFAM
jgi:hypothetical protein